MDLTGTLDYALLFDLTAYPTLRLTDTSAYGAGVAEGVKGWVTLTYPDGLVLPYGSAAAPLVSWDGAALTQGAIALRLDEQGLHQRGSFVVRYHVLHGADESWVERAFEFGFASPTLDLVEDFDPFTPVLKYRDQTDVDVTHYAVEQSTIAWTALVGPDGSIGQVSSQTSVLDLAVGGQYYNTAYRITYARALTYRHQTYAWLVVKESYSATIDTVAYAPPTVAEMLQALRQLHDEAARATCAQDMTQYNYASALLNHILLAVTNGATQGLSVMINQFVTVVQTVQQTVQNTIINTYNYNQVVGEGITEHKVEFDVTDVTREVVIPALVGRELVSVDLEGIGRKWVEGSDDTPVPPYSFVFVRAAGKLRWCDELTPDQWILAKYK